MTVIEKATASQPTMQAERHWSYTSATSDTPCLASPLATCSTRPSKNIPITLPSYLASKIYA